MTPEAGTQPVTAQPAPRAGLLGYRVAFTGRLATMARAQAEVLVVAAGGRCVAGVSSRATMLVVGMRGWPLMESGRLTRNLAEAERLRSTGRRLRIASEAEFREVIGLDPPPSPAHKPLTAQQVCAALNVEERALARWERCGLVRSAEGRYDFLDLVSLQAVAGLVARGISPVVIRESLEALKSLLPGVERPLAQLKVLVSGSGALAAEIEEALLTPSGQLEMRFGTDPAKVANPPRVLPIAPEDDRGSIAWIDEGLAHEEAGNLIAAERAYRRALELAPDDAVPQFNIGNVMLAAERFEEAAEAYSRAAALDPAHSRAWFNLAHVQEAVGDLKGAVGSLRRALAADAAFADAYFNLADLAERLGDRQTAASAWQDYLRLDPRSAWSVEARRRALALRSPVWA